jgi:hypothetical protein
LNGFPSTDFTLKNSHTTKLSLVWFSQHINGGRGLEPLVDAMADFSDQVELHLIGQLNPTFDRDFIKGKKGIHIHAPKPQSELHQFLCDFDIGVACDVPVNINRDLALTNKLIVYAQVGLFILATETNAQNIFLASSDLQYLKVSFDKASSAKIDEDRYAVTAPNGQVTYHKTQEAADNAVEEINDKINDLIKFKVIGLNNDGTVKVEDSNGNIQNVSTDELVGYERIQTDQEKLQKFADDVSKEQAEIELEDHLNDLAYAVEMGYMEDMDADAWRVAAVEVQE